MLRRMLFSRRSKSLQATPHHADLRHARAFFHDRSRCQELKFQPLPRPVLAEVLREKRGLDAGDAWFAAALSRGKPRRALDMDVQKEKTDREQFLALWDGLGGCGTMKSRPCGRCCKDREGFDRILDIGIEWLRDRLVYQETGDEPAVFAGGSTDQEEQSRFSLPRRC